MSRKLLFNPCALALAVAFAGCGGQQSEQAKTESKAAEQANAPAATHTTPSVASTLTEGAKVTLAGTTGCAHCTFSVGTECAPAMKTTAGEIVCIDGVKEGSELWKVREDQRPIQLTGIVTKPQPDGPVHIQLESYELD
jgi:hypothetical protein